MKRPTWRARGGRHGRQQGRVFIHVGAPKTGTTYLQKVLWRNADELREDGLLCPGPGEAGHHQAALELRGASFGKKRTDGATTWHDLVDAASGWRGDVLVSSELLAWATPEQVALAVEAWKGREVHVVMTLRDLARQVPAVWQEEVKNRRTLGYAEFLLAAVEAGATEPGPGGIWGGQDPRQVLGRWAQGVPPERVHVVTVPRSGGSSSALWERFCAVLGRDPELYDTRLPGANAGLGLAEAELLRQVNLALPEDFTWPSYARSVKHGIAEASLAAASAGRKIALPDEHRAALAARAEEISAYLTSSDFDVVGDLEDLHVDVPEEVAGPGRTEPDDDYVAAAAVQAMVELLTQLQTSRDRVAALRAELRGHTLAGRRSRAALRLKEATKRAAPEPALRLVRKVRYR